MTKMKVVLGLAIMLCAMVASTGSSLGATYFPTTKQGPEKAFEAKQKTTHVFTVNGQKVECTSAIFTGKSPTKAGSATQKVLPTYTGCKFAGEAAKVTNEGCEYEFQTPTGTRPNFSGAVSIKTNKASTCHLVIVATLFGISCTVNVQNEAANEGLKLVKAVDLTSNTGLNINAEVINITYTASGGGCGLAGISSGKEAKYTGEVETEAIEIL